MRKKYSKEKKHRSGEIPTGSFSDIAFLLIIYFLVATTLLKVHTIAADMPSGQKSEQAEQSDKSPAKRSPIKSPRRGRCNKPGTSYLSASGGTRNQQREAPPPQSG